MGGAYLNILRELKQMENIHTTTDHHDKLTNCVQTQILTDGILTNGISDQWNF